MFNEAAYSLLSYLQSKGPTQSHLLYNRIAVQWNCSALRRPYVNSPSVSSNAEIFAWEPER